VTTGMPNRNWACSMSEVWQRLKTGLRSDPGLGRQDLPQAAVLIAIDECDGAASVILTRRAEQLRLHAGEIAFPGGKCDPDDEDHWATALREADEEVGLPPSSIEPGGVMNTLVTRTGIEVTPCIGRLRASVDLVPNPAEIAEVFKVPLMFFAQAEELKFENYHYEGRSRRVPHYNWGHYPIWGITAAILVKLANIACEAGLAMEDYWEGS
jgi:8-oxo-dGTP pyrophosphatase MutT (NUDIX family)